jgi:serine/threonine protein kinase
VSENTCPKCGKKLSFGNVCAACAGAKLGSEPSIGQRIGNVRIESKIATGGMAIVYLGQQELTGRKVAVKVMRPERQVSLRDREYFSREAQALGEIRHPHLVELYSAGITADGLNYMVLEYVPGRTLRQMVEEDGALQPLRCVRLFRQLLLALEAVHANGIIHRDLKPDNLLIEPLPNGKERLRLADLGLVKFTERRMRPLTGHGMTVGTPCYMSPEQVRGEKLDPASDIYSTGVLMFEALTSYLPYPEEKSVDKLLDHILDTKPAKLTRADKKFERLPGVQRLLDLLMAKEPFERLTTARAVIENIDNILETDLKDDVEEAFKAHSVDEDSVDAAEDAPSAADNGILVVFRCLNRASREEISPPPQLLRHLRAFLERGEVCCAQRGGATATFGFKRTESSLKVTLGLPRLMVKVSQAFPEYELGAGVSFGHFDIDENGHPADGETLRQARRLALGAKPGQVLIPRGRAQELGIFDQS